MKVKLKVLKGSSAGKEIRIPTPKCIVGRGEDCHLRPKSDAISRRHCEITVQEGRLVVQDLGSKNGTLVNGEKIEGPRVLQSGDRVQFGPLAFEVVIDHSLGGEKKPKVSSIAEAAARTTVAGKETAQLGDNDISDWLEEADDLQRQRRLTDPETRQLRMDETDQVTLQKVLEQRAQQRKLDKETKSDDETGELQAEEQAPADKGKKKTYGKLPQRPDSGPENSRDAAADMLRKFFNKR